MSVSPKNYLSSVRTQYEQLPYPQRNPEDEKKRLNRTFGDDLEYLNHFGFGGKIQLEGLRVLDAGAGSGDASVYLAEQLRDFAGTVVHLDMSEASIGVAKERARLRNLNNIEFIHASLLDLPALNLGEFDYITCTGVLHHLQIPEDGLNAIVSALKPEGLLKIMVYGQYGRTWVYHMQNLMRYINKDVNADDFDTMLSRCKDMMKLVENTGWYQSLEHSVSDFRTMGDVGIFDLFLHSQDRAYTIPELYDFVESSGLEIQHYIPSPWRLDPAALPDSPIREILLKRDIREQQAVMEMMNGKIKKHFCYAASSLRQPPSPEDESLIPFFTQAITGMEESVSRSVQDSDKDSIYVKVQALDINLPLNPLRRALLTALDGKRNIAEILKEAHTSLADSTVDKEVLKQEFADIYEAFNIREWMFLRHPSLPIFPSMAKMQQRVEALYQ